MRTESWAQVVDTVAITEDIFQVNFSCEDGAFTHAPGQYIWVVLPELKYPDPRGEQRAFSITSRASEGNAFSIHFRKSESGYKKTLLSLPSGSKVKIIGPFGSAYISASKRIVMIAKGVGIAPFLSILRSIGKTDDDTRYTLIYLHSDSESTLFHDELMNLSSVHHFPYIHHEGSLDESLFPTTIDFSRDDFFVCGPSAMVDETYTILATKNVPFEHIHFEQHYPSPTYNLTEEDFIPRPNERNIMLQAVQDSRNHVIITDVNGLVIFANRKA